MSDMRAYNRAPGYPVEPQDVVDYNKQVYYLSTTPLADETKQRSSSRETVKRQRDNENRKAIALADRTLLQASSILEAVMPIELTSTWHGSDGPPVYGLLLELEPGEFSVALVARSFYEAYMHKMHKTTFRAPFSPGAGDMGITDKIASKCWLT